MATSDLRQMLYRFPSVVELVKRVYKSRWLNNRLLFQKLVLMQAFKADALVASTPPSISVETTLACNAKCLMCLHSRRHMHGVMSLDVFKKIVDDVVRTGVKSLCLSIYGEPLTDRYWLQRIEIVRAAALTYSFFSNGSLMTSEMLDPMFELGGWEAVNFSVNGLSPSVYEQMMPPLNREAVYSRIAMFLEMKRRRATALPRVTISCVRTRQNIDEERQFIKYWRRQAGVDRVIMADCGSWLDELHSSDLVVGNLARGVSDETWLAPCPSLWTSLNIYYDGRIAPCCEDAARRELIVGDMKDESIREILHGVRLRGLRRMHLSDQRSRHAICGKCRCNLPWL